MMRLSSFEFILFVVLILSSAPATWGWSKEGHIMTCRIAQVILVLFLIAWSIELFAHKMANVCFSTDRVFWSLRQLILWKICYLTMSMATYQHSACGLTKSDIGINIVGQARFTSSTHLMRLAPLSIQVK